MSVVSHDHPLFFSRNYTLYMQLVSLLTASAITLTLLGHSIATWNAPRERQAAQITAAAYQQAVRHTLVLAMANQQSVDVKQPDTPQQVQIRTLAGRRITAYPDGTISPGQIRICGRINDLVLNLSSLGRVAMRSEQPACDLPT
jgi:hypothetical protein